MPVPSLIAAASAYWSLSLSWEATQARAYSYGRYLSVAQSPYSWGTNYCPFSQKQSWVSTYSDWSFDSLLLRFPWAPLLRDSNHTGCPGCCSWRRSLLSNAVTSCAFADEQNSRRSCQCSHLACWAFTESSAARGALRSWRRASVAHP